MRLPMKSGTIAGLLVRSGYVTIPLLLLYGLLAVPLGMPYGRCLLSGPPLIMSAIGLVGTGLIVNETGRLLLVSGSDGADDALADCAALMISQFLAVAVAVGGLALGLVVATGMIHGV